jgi:hypothetical protein
VDFTHLHRGGAWVAWEAENVHCMWFNCIFLMDDFFGTRRNEWYAGWNMALVGLMGRDFTVFSPVLYRLSVILSCCMFLTMGLTGKPKNYMKLVWTHYVWLPWPLKWCTSIGFNYTSTF